jgi:hypothetical protein
LYDFGKDKKDKGILDIGIAKSRQLGKQGIVRLIWIDREHRYGDMAEEGALAIR